MLKIYKQSLAEEDLENIWLYSFETRGEHQADKYYDELIKGMELLAYNPDLGVSCADIREGYRQFKLNHHVMYYKVTPPILTVVRVLHERMESAEHFKD